MDTLPKIEPMKLSPRSAPFDNPDYLFELKHDGFRSLAYIAVGKCDDSLEIAQQIAAHESSRTTGLYDRRDDDVSLDEVERISI